MFIKVYMITFIVVALTMVSYGFLYQGGSKDE